MQSPITDLIWPHPLPYLALQYCKLAVAVLVMVTTVVLVRCVRCPCASWHWTWAKLRRSVRHFRERRAKKGTVLDGLCSIVVLTYGFVIQQSFTVLQLGIDIVYTYTTTMRLSTGEKQLIALIILITALSGIPTALHITHYAAIAIISSVLVLPLPLLLLYYPCVPALMQRITKRSSPLITCHKLAPVFDVFQSAYKPKLRFFAALTLLYRFAIWLPMAFVLSRVVRLCIITFVFILILSIHSRAGSALQ